MVRVDGRPIRDRPRFRFLPSHVEFSRHAPKDQLPLETDLRAGWDRLLSRRLDGRWRAPVAHADTLTLNGSQAAACPACVAEDGGARVVNAVLKLAEATGKTVGYDGPVSGFDYAADASRMFTNYAGLDAGGGALTTTQQVAKARIAGQIVEVGEASGVLPDVIAQAPTALRSITIPQVAAGVAAFAVGYGIGTAGKWLVGELFTGSSEPAVGGWDWTGPVWRLQPYWDGANLHAFDGSASGPLVSPAHWELQGWYASSSYRYTSFGCTLGSCPGTNRYHNEWLTFERGVSGGHEVVWTSAAPSSPTASPTSASFNAAPPSRQARSPPAMRPWRRLARCRRARASPRG